MRVFSSSLYSRTQPPKSFGAKTKVGIHGSTGTTLRQAVCPNHVVSIWLVLCHRLLWLPMLTVHRRWFFQFASKRQVVLLDPLCPQCWDLESLQCDRKQPHPTPVQTPDSRRASRRVVQRIQAELEAARDAAQENRKQVGRSRPQAWNLRNTDS